MDPDFIRSFQENLKCQYSSLESAEKSAEIQNAIFYKLVGLFEQLKTRCDELEKTVASLTSPENSGTNMNVKKLKENAIQSREQTETEYEEAVKKLHEGMAKQVGTEEEQDEPRPDHRLKQPAQSATSKESVHT